MYMTKIVLDPVMMKRAGVYEEHRALWKIFSDSSDRERDFIYRRMDPSSFLAVSSREPAETRFLRTLQVKEYNPQLEVGERLHFSLRFNPIVKRRDENGRQQRIDIVQDRRKEMERQGLPRTEWDKRLEIAEEAGAQWIMKRSETLGFELEHGENGPGLIVESYSQERFQKGKGRMVNLSCMDVRGFAKVTDPENIKRALFNGVGCAKGFGFGLLLVRRA
ncbi:type I-E CRISPR-associated protein Cas6/Cse3/CasE [Maridesulfovibrio sp.]|uniref:type I-E CRISPR-associated protein Cas6/Cse3/CasE n=1 Tax=Maridesulfovibrio sp. TaxID=2795000 RepID=UPI0029C9D6F5|nr:type I-E CRISPR-associated protein Cas6/Cse3/CasE [Maridesulfovibrio sp.]